MTVDIRASATDYICALFPRRAGLDEDELKHRIRTEVIDQALRLRIAKETEPIRNLIFALGVLGDRSCRGRGNGRMNLKLLRDATALPPSGWQLLPMRFHRFDSRFGPADESGW